jgi:DNA helicase-2/ATP-dependent DNA helicase PcrA
MPENQGPDELARRELPAYLEVLNPEQREAVLHNGLTPSGTGSARPLLILAGAGSGKTRVITTKIAYLIRERGLEPRSILAVTFTNKAAREMAERAKQIDERAAGAMLRTFHSFGAWFLRRNGVLAGLNSNFVIYDDDDTTALLSSLMEDSPKVEVKKAAYGISQAKDYFLGPDDPELARIDHSKKFRNIYARYEQRLSQIGNVDFGDLIKKPVEILRANPEVARRFRERFRVIMVDEYQDSNVAQFELLKELCGSETYVCVVGDDDQSIYRFRGAEVRNILEFPDRFPGTDIIRLERNYRSIEPILRVASAVVDHNQDRLGKTLRAERGGGKAPTLAFLPDQDAEVVFCAELIQNAVKGKTANYSDWAILYRMNAQSMGFETEFLRRRIPYRVVGSLKFYEREEIKDALALLSFLVNPRDEVAFRRVVNKPTRGVGPVSVDRVILAAVNPAGGIAEDDALSGDLATMDTASGDGVTANNALFGDLAVVNPIGGVAGDDALSGDLAAMDAAGGGGVTANDASFGDLAAAALRILPELPAKACAGLKAFLAAVEAGARVLDGEAAEKRRRDRAAGDAAGKKREELRAGEGLSQCLVTLINEAGIADYHLAHDEIGGNQRIANLQELVNAASLYPLSREGLLDFLEHIELDRSIEGEGKDDNDVVTLITLHNTKGLEFRRVIITGVEQGIFPRDDKKDEDLEEERRLFYVGATRAMDELYLCSCAMRRLFGRTQPMEPSPFLQEAAGGKDSPDKPLLRILGNAPYGFSVNTGAAGLVANRRTGAGAFSGGYGTRGQQRSSDGRWRIGERLFHDDHGYGAVIEIRETDEDGPVIRVRFDTGKESRFLSASQSSRFTKIGDE